MFVKVTAIFLLFGICYALPAEETKPVDLVATTSQPAPSEPLPVLVGALPNLPKPDDSDLKTDASSWYHHSWYHHNYPSYHRVHNVPHHTHWHAHW